MLLALHAKGGDSRKAVDACLRKKLCDGHATITSWLGKALQGHQVRVSLSRSAQMPACCWCHSPCSTDCALRVQACYRDQLWPSLLALAEAWSAAREGAVAAAAEALYEQLFVAFDAAWERQQVLHALHGHLGSGQPCQQDVALQVGCVLVCRCSWRTHVRVQGADATLHHPWTCVQVLSSLAARHVAVLRQYSGYLGNILDHLEGFSNSQLQQVFAMFAALTAREPEHAAAGDGGLHTAAGGGGSRLQDELVITLNKALAQPHPCYKRIGVVGTLALLQREGSEYELLMDVDGSAAGGEGGAWHAWAAPATHACACLQAAGTRRLLCLCCPLTHPRPGIAQRLSQTQRPYCAAGWRAPPSCSASA